MKILSGMITTEEELKAAVGIAGPAFEQAVANMNLTERQQEVLDLMKGGMSLGDIMGLKKEHRDALLVQCFQLLQAGEIEKARDGFLRLYQLEPLDERSIFALATTYQMEGNFVAAGQLYVHFLALDATNAEGYLRLGECFMGSKEYEDAKACFKTAKLEAERGHGQPTTLAQATALLDLAEQKLAAAE
jgi:Flp pilus assembly protein TadD